MQIFNNSGEKLKFLGIGLLKEVYFILKETNPNQIQLICDDLVKKAENFDRSTKISYQIAFYPEEGRTAENLLNKVREKRLPSWNRQHKTVLIAEDEPNNLKLAQDILEISGYATLEATDGQQAIELARSYHPDLILMDIQMPIMNGLEATKVLKADPKTCFIPVIALTAHAMKGDENKVMAAGCEEYITKPLDTRRLLNMVELYLAKN
jgi:two-component system cell cycle response regulator DivK